MKLFLAAILIILPAAFGQNASPNTDADTLIRTALAHFNANKQKAYAYTYIELWHNQNFNRNGKIRTDQCAKFESVFIDDLPYLRKIEENGKPLTGKSAQLEETRYEAAVKARKGMTLEQKQAAMQVKNLVFPIHLNLLPELYDSRIVGTEILNGRTVIHIDSVPRKGIAPKNERARDALRTHLQVWIDVHDKIFSRFDGELLAPTDKMQPGSVASVSYTPVDGVWLPLRTVVRGQAKYGHSIGFRSEVAYSNFQKFRVDVRVLDHDDDALPTAY